MIPYVREVQYLSPSSLRTLEESPVEFYLQKLGPIECKPKGDEQGFPAAVGCAFDAFVKTELAGRLKITCPPLAHLLKTVTIRDRAERDRALDMGRSLLVGYEKSGALGALLAERPRDLEHHPEVCFAPGTLVPIKGQLDATFRAGRGARLVLDWKTTGANRPGEESPSQGYQRLFDSEKPGVDQGPHGKAGIPFHEIPVEGPRWATQLTMYSWMLGHPIRERVAAIDQLIVGREGRVRVAQFRTKLTVRYQQEVRRRLLVAWDRVQTCNVVPPELAGVGIEMVGAFR